MKILKIILILCGLALAVAAVTLAVLYAPAWGALAALGGYMAAIFAFFVSIATSGHTRTPDSKPSPSVTVNEDGSISYSYEVQR